MLRCSQPGATVWVTEISGAMSHSLKNDLSLDSLGKENDKSDDGEKEDADSPKTVREQWTHQLDFILSVVGYNVGLGNLWRFPYVCNRNGGGAFLIPFVICLVVCGMPLTLLEMGLGQFSGRSAMAVWEISPLFRGLGIGANIVSALCLWYFIIMLAWDIYYIFVSMAPVLPYTTCNNWWNTPSCVSRATFNSTVTSSSNFTDVIADLPHFNISRVNKSTTPFEEYWRYNTLQISGGLEELGSIQWHLTLCLLVAWVLIAACLIKGVKSLGKVVYVTAIAPYLLLTILLVRGVTLDGAVDGLIFYLKPDFSKLLEVQVWVEAAVQVFYSLGPGWGGFITMASYNRFNNNLLRDAIMLPIISEGTSLYAGLVVFSVLGYMAKRFQVPIADVVTSGPGLGMVVYPEALATLPLPQLWAFLFFTMILLVGLDTQFAMVETLLTTIVDAYYHILRKRRMLFTFAFCTVCFLLGLPLVTKGGMYLFYLVDWYIAALALFIISILECLVVAWIYGIDMFMEDIKQMVGRRPPVIFKWMLCLFTPLMLLMILVLTVFQYPAPTYGSYVYPRWAEIFGWLLATIPVVPIPVVMVQELMGRKGSLLKRLKDSLKPSAKWRPTQREYQELYAAKIHGREAFSSWRTVLFKPKSSAASFIQEKV